jgi:hypothetical protein
LAEEIQRTTIILRCAQRNLIVKKVLAILPGQGFTRVVPVVSLTQSVGLELGFYFMKKQLVLSVLALGAAAVSSRAATLTSFTYNQNDATTGSGTIGAFSFNGHDFGPTAMPAATVVSPGSVAAPAGFVGSMTAQALGSNEPNSAVGLLWTGVVTATATDGATIQIPLVFAQKVTQSPADTSDYQWNVTYGDSPANGIDTSITAARFAMYLSRDTTIDATDTANLFQRYTQLTQNFVAGATPDSFGNTDTATAAIKDATDPAGAPLGTDAAGRNLAFYYGWRDGGTLNAGGAILVDQFNVSGLLEVNEASLVVPEPTTGLLMFGGLGALVALRRRKA